MKTEIACYIHDPYREVIRKWASVGRTLKAAMLACERMAQSTPPYDGRWQSEAAATARELAELIPALEHMYMQVRDKLWIAESASPTPVVWPYDDVSGCWSVVVDAARRRSDKAVCMTEGATYILGDATTFPPKSIAPSLRWRLGHLPVLLVSIDGGGRVRWVVQHNTYEATDKQAIAFFGLQKQV